MRDKVKVCDMKGECSDCGHLAECGLIDLNVYAIGTDSGVATVHVFGIRHMKIKKELMEKGIV